MIVDQTTDGVTKVGEGTKMVVGCMMVIYLETQSRTFNMIPIEADIALCGLHKGVFEWRVCVSPRASKAIEMSWHL